MFISMHIQEKKMFKKSIQYVQTDMEHFQNFQTMYRYL